MAEAQRYFVRSPDGKDIAGYNGLGAARSAVLDYGDGAALIDTLAGTYFPMLQQCRDGNVVYAGYGGWDTGRFGVDRDFIESIKKGHPAIVHAFIAKGADVNARDSAGGPALHWAVGGGKREIVRLMLDHGADICQTDGHGQTALDLARKKGRIEITGILERAVSQ